jgi:hypothetical protein
VRVPTAEQWAVLQAAADGHDLVKISAGAGTGKTSTTEMLAAVPPRRSGQQLYSQFAVAGGEDAARRMAGTGVAVLRPGQLAWRAAQPWQKERRSEPRVPSAAVAEAIGLTDSWVRDSTMLMTAAAWTGQMRQAVVNFCRSDKERVLLEHVPPHIKGQDRDEMAKAAQWLWDRHLNGPSGAVSYTQDHLKKHWSLRCPRYSYSRIMLDEAQDTNPCDMHVYTAQDTQLIVVGDSQQQLYEWRGAVDALSDDVLPGGVWLPLTGSFRFGPQIAEQANVFLGMLGAGYQLTGLGQPGRTGPLGGAEDAVLCRTNAECMQAALGALQAGRTVALAGRTRDELLGLSRAALALRAGRRTEHPDLIGFPTWRDFCRYAERDPDGQDYLAMVRLVQAHGERLVTMLSSMSDGPADVVCATVWKAKGLEWPAVRCAGDFWPGEGGDFNAGLARWWMGDGRREAFLRLCYVAVTRAQAALDAETVSWVRGF